MSKLYTLIAVIAICSIAVPASAQIVNGGFETGVLGPWVAAVPVGGFAGAVTGYGPLGVGTVGWGPAGGTYFAALKTDGPGSHTDMHQTFAGTAGQLLEFDVFFDGGDYLPYNDHAHALLIGPTGPVTLWYQDINLLGDYGDDGWTHVSYVLPASGSYTLEFGITNDLDGVQDSYMGVDNVVIPAPAAVVLGAMGLGLVGWIKKRK